MLKQVRGICTTVLPINTNPIWAVLRKQVNGRSSARASGASNWPVGLLALPLLLVCLPAQAVVNYSFSDDSALLPLSCSGGNGSFTCTVLTLLPGDTLTVSGNANVTVEGDLKTGSSSQINTGGSASSLNLTVKGLTTLGEGSAVTANVDGVGVINVYSKTFIGTLQTTNAAINVGKILPDDAVLVQQCNDQVVQTSVTGSIFTTVTGVINIEAISTVSGGLTTTTGAINVGYCSSVGPVISVSAGAITTGARSTVNGQISTGDGAVTTGADSLVTGAVATKVGAVTIGERG